MKAYRFKITLSRSKPPIWRRVEVPVSMDFETFSRMIQELFGFDGYHLSCFEFPGEEVQMMEEENPDCWNISVLMKDHQLGELERFKQFSYTYDFGDSWEFKIVREAVLDDYPADHPVLIKYKGDNLVEDIGGIWGYYELLERLQNPKRKNEDEEDEDWYSEIDPESIRFSEERAAHYLDSLTCDEKVLPPLAYGFHYSDDWEDAVDDEDDDHEIDPEEFFGKMAASILRFADLDDIRLPKTKEEHQYDMRAAYAAGIYEAIRDLSDGMNLPFHDLLDYSTADDEILDFVSMIEFASQLPKIMAEEQSGGKKTETKSKKKKKKK